MVLDRRLTADRVQYVYKTHRKGITRALYASLVASIGIRLLFSLNWTFPRRKNTDLEEINVGREKHEESDELEEDEKSEKFDSMRHDGPKVAIDMKFLRNLLILLRISFPKLVSMDSVLVILQAISLVIRTYLSLSIARLDGQITAHLVKGEGTEFLKSVGLWLAIGLPASAINASIQYLQKLIALRVRTRLTNYVLDRYLVPDQQQPVYYQIQQGVSKANSTISSTGVNVGQLMAADTAKFASALPRLYANLAKPLLDVTVYTYQLSQSIGGDNVFFLAMAIQLSARFLRLAAPPFGEFVATEAKLEGDFRSAHSRLIDYSEEVAFWGGEVPEKLRLDQSFYELVKHVNTVIHHRLTYSSLEDFVIKYWWGAAGLILCSIPIFSGNSDVKNRAENYIVNRKLLLLSNDAVGRLMTSYKEISSLAGSTSRVAEFVTSIEDLASDKSEKVADEHRGIVEIGDYVEFDKVPIVSPTGEILVRNLTFRINPGHHLLIVGPNGSGKSSLFRVLGGIWPLEAGRIVRPSQNDIFYIPQRPYLSRGSLRQQIIYPEKEAESKATDEQLLKILAILGMEGLVTSVGGLNAVREWRDDFSMGAQQKIAAARLFYHKPKFAILDECTASVTLDTETIIYTHAKDLGISLLTVSHRASLWQYHDKILQFDGQGNYLFADLNPAERLSLEQEKLKIEYKLRKVDSMKERLVALQLEKIRRSSRAASRAASRVTSRSTSQVPSRSASPNRSR